MPNPSWVQTAAGGTDAAYPETSETATFAGGATAAGDTIVAIVIGAVKAGASFTLSDGTANVYTQVVTNGSSADFPMVAFVCVGALSAGHVTVTCPSDGVSSVGRVVALEYANVSGSESLGSVATGSGASSFSGTTSKANEMVVAMLSWSNTFVATAGSGYAQRDQNNAGNFTFTSEQVEDQLFSAAGSQTISNSSSSTAWSGLALGLFPSTASGNALFFGCNA